MKSRILFLFILVGLVSNMASADFFREIPKDCRIYFPHDLKSFPAYRDTIQMLYLKGYSHDEDSPYSVKVDSKLISLKKDWWGDYIEKCDASFVLLKQCTDKLLVPVISLTNSNSFNHGGIVPIPRWGSLGVCQQIALSDMLERIPSCKPAN